MKDAAQKVTDQLLAQEEQELFEMSNLSSDQTGLGQRIWISVDYHGRYSRPRLKVQGSDKRLYPLSINDPVEFLADWPPGLTAAQFKALQSFVVLNRAALLAYWNDEIDTRTVLQRIQAI